MPQWRALTPSEKRWHLLTILNEATGEEKRGYVRDVCWAIPDEELRDFRLFLSDESTRREAASQSAANYHKFRAIGAFKAPTPVTPDQLSAIQATYPQVEQAYKWDSTVVWIDGEHVCREGVVYRKQGPDVGPLNDPKNWVAYVEPVKEVGEGA